MNLTLHLPPETEAKLQEQSALTGKSPECLAIEALEERLAQSEETAQLPAD